MKYVKTFESLKDMYSGKDIGKTNSIYFVVSENEEYVVRNDIDSSHWDEKAANNAQQEYISKVFLNKTDDTEFPSITHYFSFKTEDDANAHIETLLNENAVGKLYLSKNNLEIGQWDNTYKYFDLDGEKRERGYSIDSMFEEPLKLKVVKYIYGLMRDEGLNI